MPVQGEKGFGRSRGLGEEGATGSFPASGVGRGAASSHALGEQQSPFPW